MKVRAALALAASLVLIPTAATAANLHAPHVGTTVVCDGPVLWHFVHNQVTTDSTGTITATFAGAGAIVQDADVVLSKVRHYNITTPAGDTLLGASDTIAEGKLVLSHTECLPGEPPDEELCEVGSEVAVSWDVELGRPDQWMLFETDTSPVSLLPGTYSVELTSTDVNHQANFQTNQNEEQWYVELKLAGSSVAVSGTIADLPTDQTTLTQDVGNIVLPDGADEAVATHHLAGVDVALWGSPESVEPTTAVFTCVGGLTTQS